MEHQADGSNALVLEFCRFRKKDGDYSQIYPVLAAADSYKGRTTGAL